MKQYYVRYRTSYTAREYFEAIDIDSIGDTAIETLYSITLAIAKKHFEAYHGVISDDNIIILNIDKLN